MGEETRSVDMLQYRHLISAPVDRTSAVPGCTPMDYMSKNKPTTSIARIACESKLRSVLTSSMHPWSRNCWQSGVRSRIMPGLCTHLVQEFNVGTVV